MNYESWRVSFQSSEKAARSAYEKLEATTAENENLRLEAQAHAQEARTQRATVHEIYQIISGGNGEPGDWNGAEPVRKAFVALAVRVEKAERNSERDKDAFVMMCTALQDIEDAVGIDTGGWNGPAPAIHAVQALAAHVDMLGSVVEKISTVAPEYLDHLASDAAFVLRSKPESNLARRDAKLLREYADKLEADEAPDAEAGDMWDASQCADWMREQAEHAEGHQ